MKCSAELGPNGSDSQKGGAPSAFVAREISSCCLVERPEELPAFCSHVKKEMT